MFPTTLPQFVELGKEEGESYRDAVIEADRGASIVAHLACVSSASAQRGSVILGERA